MIISLLIIALLVAAVVYLVPKLSDPWKNPIIAVIVVVAVIALFSMLPGHVNWWTK